MYAQHPPRDSWHRFDNDEEYRAIDMPAGVRHLRVVGSCLGPSVLPGHEQLMRYLTLENGMVVAEPPDAA